MNKLISVVIPAHNEEKNLALVFNKVKDIFAKDLPAYYWEIIFVNDGSIDNSEAVLEDLSQKDRRVKYIEFSKNFGKEAATSAGLDMANGEAVIMLDADLQHPIELIPEFIKQWEKGPEVVVGVRNKCKSDSSFKKFGSFMFYKIMSLIGETKITSRATDFRLLDKKVVMAFRKFTEHDRMTRGLIDWLGFKSEYIEFDANERINGNASYSKTKLIKLALSSFISHSLFPLKFIGYLGLFTTIIFGLAGFLIFVGKYIFNNSFAYSFSGPAQLAILVIFLVGLVMAGMGLVALYVANIKSEVTNRPNYVVRKSNF